MAHEHEKFEGAGIHIANFADFMLDLRNGYSQSRFYVGLTQ
jgi:hypothetical protein